MTIANYSLNCSNFFNEFIPLISDFLGAVIDNDGDYYVAEFKPVPGYYLGIKRPNANNRLNLELFFCTAWDASTNTATNKSPIPQTAYSSLIHANFFVNNSLFGALGWEPASNRKKLVIVFKEGNKWFVINTPDMVGVGYAPSLYEVAPNYPSINFLSIASDIEVITTNNKYFYSPLFIIQSGLVYAPSQNMFVLSRPSNTIDNPIVLTDKILFPGAFLGLTGLKNYFEIIGL